MQRLGGDKKAYDLQLRPALMVQAIHELQDAGVEADVWKIEGIERKEDCQKVVAAARRAGRDKVGCIILGRGEDDKKVRQWLTTAAGVPGFIGFAVGRTTFWDPLVDYRAEQDHARRRRRADRRILPRVGGSLRAGEVTCVGSQPCRSVDREPEIVSNQGSFTGHSDVVRLADEEATVRVLSQAVLGLWEVVNNLTRLRPTRRQRYRVTIFGSARAGADHWVYAAVRDLAAELTRLGCDIVTGGGPGLMQAANEGARLAGVDSDQGSVGIRVDLPFEQDVNPFVGQVFEHRTFFSRLHHFVLVSDAFVVVPGGIGTVLETMMIWQLLQVRKLDDTPLILAGAMWAELVEWARKSMLLPDCPLASPEDFAIPICCRTGPEILEVLRAHHGRWKANQEARP